MTVGALTLTTQLEAPGFRVSCQQMTVLPRRALFPSSSWKGKLGFSAGTRVPAGRAGFFLARGALYAFLKGACVMGAAAAIRIFSFLFRFCCANFLALACLLLPVLLELELGLGLALLEPLDLVVLVPMVLICIFVFGFGL